MFQWLQLASTNDAAAEPLVYEKSIDEEEQEFNEKVRVNVIVLLTFICLYVFSYLLLLQFHMKRERDSWFHADDDAKVHRISLHICAITVGNSFGAILMLPMSMISNEVVHLYPHSYWVQWLNGALIHKIWECIFIISNASLFILIPFSYFFTESEGFSGYKRGLLPRFYETITVLTLVLVVTFSIATVFMAFIEKDDSYFNLMKLVSQFYLSTLYAIFLYGWMLFTLTACTPGGLTLIYDKVGSLLVKPKIFGDNENKIQQIRLTEDAMKRRLKTDANRLSSERKEEFLAELESLKRDREILERQKKVSSFHRNIGYPLAMLCLLLLTFLALFLVSIHILKLLFIGDHELHPSTVRDEYGSDYRNPMKQMNTCRQMDEDGSELPEFCRRLWSGKDGDSPPRNGVGGGGQVVDNSHFYSLGANSLSMFGIFGTLIEVCVIMFIFVGSLVGLYNLPGFRQLLPQTDNTSITIIIINCLILQLLACSLPVLSRVLGITDFELQGNFGKLDWLGNFPSIFLFNLIFAIETCLCLANKFTNKMQRELYKALRINKSFLSRVFTRNKNSKNPRITSSSNPPNCEDDDVTTNDDDDDDDDVNTSHEESSQTSNNIHDMENGGCDDDSLAPTDGSGGGGGWSLVCSSPTSSLTLISALSPFRVFGVSTKQQTPTAVARH